ENVLLAGPDLAWAPPDLAACVEPDDGPFHFGARLAQVVRTHAYSPLLYFGAGSVPLLPVDTIIGALAMLVEAERAGRRLVVTNNLHSCDWLGVTRAADVTDLIARSPRDNGLAWALREDARSEERRVGKECRSRWSEEREKEKDAGKGECWARKRIGQRRRES